jgi:hypothetical protein
VVCATSPQAPVDPFRHLQRRRRIGAAGGAHGRAAHRCREGIQLGGDPGQYHLLALLGPDEGQPLVPARSDHLHPARVRMREPPSERDGRKRAARQPQRDHRARLVAGGGRQRRHLLDLLPGQPAQLVDLVHTHVDDDSAAAPLELGRRRVLIPLVEDDQRQLAESPCGDPLPQRHQLRQKPAVVPDL